MGSIISVRLTDYYPFHKGLTEEQRRMEGGVRDRKGKPLYPLEDYLAGTAPYVSVACDHTGGPPGSSPEFKRYGYKVRLLGVEEKHQICYIEFRLVDTGGHFFGKGKTVRVSGHEPIDVCRRARPTGDARLGGMLTTLVLVGPS